MVDEMKGGPGVQLYKLNELRWFEQGIKKSRRALLHILRFAGLIRPTMYALSIKRAS